MNGVSGTSALAIVLSAMLAPALAQTQIYSLPGENAGDQFGSAARSAGDVDGDGFTDLVVASETKDYVKVVSGLTGVERFRLSGSVPGERFGFSVDGVGDLDGDGFGEVIVGAIFAGALPEQGRADVYSGRSGQLMYRHWGDSSLDHFGYSVAGLGDVDGDGVGDYAVGAVDDDDFGIDSGSVRLFSGATGLELRTLYGDAPRQLFGYSVAGLADRTGDGRAEVLVGGPYLVNSQTNQAGVARIFDGATGALLWEQSGFAPKDAFGRSVGPAGDVDGDGVEDVIIGAPQPVAGSRGYARVFSGASGALLWDWAGANLGGLFGSSVSGAGDVNADGRADLAVGVPRDHTQGGNSGAVRVISGRSGLDLYTLNGAGPNQFYGSVVDGSCDVNGDSIRDLIVTSPGDSMAFVTSTRNLPLRTDGHQISFSSTTRQVTLSFDLGPAHAGQAYTIFGAFTGTTPGTPFGSLMLPLNADRYFKYTLRLRPNSTIKPPQGALDAQGKGQAVFTPPRLAPRSYLLGRTFHHAVVIYDSSSLPILATNAVPVTFVP